MRRDVLVYGAWHPLAEPALMGILSADRLKGREHFSFEFDAQWLRRMPPLRLDPDLPLVIGRSMPRPSLPIFGIFADASPDRWGRRLMMRREHSLARKEHRTERNLMALDFLLGVDDMGRMGALRLKSAPSGRFLADNESQPIPPMTELRKLERAASMIEDEDQEAVESALTLLFQPGSSLGGARPKANVRDPSGILWIAKFPSGSDEIDVGAWEEVTASLARSSGIQIAESKAVKLGSKHHTFLTKRFDRSGVNVRHMYASAMTLLGKQDGEGHESSYLDLAEIIISQCIKPREQLQELWRRMIFSIAVANVDDHLRNHGFLYSPDNQGWILSPAFDINPTLDAAGLTLAIDETDHSLSLDRARSVAPFFQLNSDEAESIINQVLTARMSWRAIAKKLGIKAAEINLMASVFDAVRS